MYKLCVYVKIIEVGGIKNTEVQNKDHSNIRVQNIPRQFELCGNRSLKSSTICITNFNDFS